MVEVRWKYCEVGQAGYMDGKHGRGAALKR